MVSRYQGGHNAGTTLTANGQVYKLRYIPSGVLYPTQLSVLGNGVVVNPKSLVGTLARLATQGVTGTNLHFSDRAHVILPYQLKLDKLQTTAKGADKIGTTLRGLGPAYMDKAARVGLHLADLLDKDIFATRLLANLLAKLTTFVKVYNSTPNTLHTIFTTYYNYGQQLLQYVCDTSIVLKHAIHQGQTVLFTGAQGILHTLHQDSYPFVTYSLPAGGVTVGAGVGASKIHRVVGVAKDYTSRVGDGHFPTTLLHKTGDLLRLAGTTFGTVTGRPRHFGWLHAVVVRTSRRVAGITDLCLNSIHVLTGLDTVKICVA